MLRPAAAIAALAFVLLGCDPSHALAIDNQTDKPLIVRVTETTYADDFGVTVSYFRVAPNTKAYALPQETGPLKGSVDVLDADCNLIGTAEARSGSVVTIRDDISLDLRYLGEEDQGLEEQLPETGPCP